LIYGDFNLQKGDHDGASQGNVLPVWGGTTNPPIIGNSGETSPIIASGTTASFTVHEYVRQVQEDLLRLGFGVGGIPDGKFSERTEWAVREFQIYAKMQTVARVKAAKFGQLLLSANGSPVSVSGVSVYYDSSAKLVAAAGQAPAATGGDGEGVSFYVDSLESTTNQKIYSGPVSGVLNAATREAIEFWLENHYRCPVVIEAWRVNSSGTRIGLAQKGCNLWAHDDFNVGAPRIFFRDFTNYYSFPAGRSSSEYQTLGYYEAQAFGGPNASVKHSWKTEAEMSISNVLGIEYNPTLADAPNFSTYRTVRVVAEAECFGRFDVINAWDNALVSAGPCHWTMGLYGNDKYQNGEFPAFIAYLKSVNLDAFMSAFGFFGLSPSKVWGDDTIYSSATRTYATWVSLPTESYNDTNSPHAESELKEVGRTKDEAHYLKSWHWFYRLSMAGRTIGGYRKAMWGMAVARVSKILDKDVSFSVNGSTVSAKLGQIFTSEKAVAILLRWHVYRPSHVVHNTYGRVVPAIQDAIHNASTLSWGMPVASWTDSHESALTSALLTKAAAVNTTITNAVLFGADQPQGSVRVSRNSFSLDESF